MKFNFRFFQKILMWSILMSSFSISTHFTSAQNSLMFREGVVIDVKNQLVYFQDADQKVQARSIDNGKLLWVTNQSAKPLALAEGQLICQSGSSFNTNKLELINLKEGEETFGFGYELPRNVKVNIGQTLNSNFNIKSHYQKGQLYFSWKYEHINRKGIYDPANTKPTYQKGAFSLELGSDSPNEISIEDLPRILAGRSIVPNKENSIPKQEGFQFLSKDDNHVLVSLKVANDATFEAYNWSLYSVNGKKIGEIRDYRSYAPFYVTPSNVLIYEVGPYLRNVKGKMIETPLQLVAIDLISGKKLWDTPIFDPVYRGPTPP